MNIGGNGQAPGGEEATKHRDPIDNVEEVNREGTDYGTNYLTPNTPLPVFHYIMRINIYHMKHLGLYFR